MTARPTHAVRANGCDARAMEEACRRVAPRWDAAKTATGELWRSFWFQSFHQSLIPHPRAPRAAGRSTAFVAPRPGL